MPKRAAARIVTDTFLLLRSQPSYNTAPKYIQPRHILLFFKSYLLYDTVTYAQGFPILPTQVPAPTDFPYKFTIAQSFTKSH